MSQPKLNARRKLEETLYIAIAASIFAAIAATSGFGIRSDRLALAGAHQAHDAMQSSLSDADLVRASDWVFRQSFDCIRAQKSTPFSELFSLSREEFISRGEQAYTQCYGEQLKTLSTLSSDENLQALLQAAPTPSQ